MHVTAFNFLAEFQVSTELKSLVQNSNFSVIVEYQYQPCATRRPKIPSKFILLKSRLKKLRTLFIEDTTSCVKSSPLLWLSGSADPKFKTSKNVNKLEHNFTRKATIFRVLVADAVTLIKSALYLLRTKELSTKEWLSANICTSPQSSEVNVLK